MNPERKPTIENQINSTHHLIFIDDQTSFFSYIIKERLSRANRLSLKFINPQDLEELVTTDFSGETALFVDQFVVDRKFRNITSQFLAKASEINPKLIVIEMSHTPEWSVYKGTGIDSTDDVVNWFKKLPKGIKNPEIIFRRIRNEFNLGFTQAQNAIYASESYVRNIFGQMFNNPQFEKLCELVEVDSTNLDESIRHQEAENYRLAIHLCWMVMGHLSINNNEEFYGLPLQRLKELITPQQQPE